MRKALQILIGALLATGLSCGGAGAARPAAQGGEHWGRLHASGPAAAPTGFMVFCLKTPAFCQGGGASEVAYSEALAKTLAAVNRSVNSAIRPVSDRADVWSVNVRSGDCEDYALTKRARLMALGLPSGSLRIATARTSSGIGHAVLVVRTSAGDLVLDNMRADVVAWSKSGLSWIALSGANPLRWSRIG